MAQMQSIQWYPGHMTKTRRKIQEILPLIDAVVEIIDARIPSASRNPELAALIEGKPLIVLMNKADMADARATAAWVRHFEKSGISALPIDCRTGKGIGNFKTTAKTVLADKLQKYREKGMVGRPLRLMVVGIPNVGKSSFINRISGGGRAKVADRPGVTRGNQWFTVDKELELLDTPGVLWPKFDDQLVAERLAFTGAVKDQVVDIETLAVRLLEVMATDYPGVLESRYKLTPDGEEAYELLELLGRKRGMLLRGGAIDTERAATMLLDEYRGGRLGNLTLEMPPKGE